jgi:aminopeptidase N
VTQSNLTRDEARERARLLSDLAYEVSLDLSEDDEETFRSETRLRFRCAEPGGSTFADFTARSIESIELNGRTIDLAAHDGTRLRLEGLGAENDLRIVARCGYRQDGTGMTRFVDPVDDAVYVYSDLEPMDAHKAFACFDQPDLKGTFAFTVRAPEGWTVLSNMAPQGEAEPQDHARVWRFGITPEIPTYITAVVAGPLYGARGRAGDIELGVYCRASLGQHLDTEEILDITRRGFEFFERAFDYPYPFDKYDQVFVPNYMAGAMENAGCVTFNEHYVFRSRETEVVHERRAETILHEMAHMWFGDLVTMRWWNDLWLNESFASYASVLAVVAATRFREGWTTFAETEKHWAYRQDQLPTTHPIVAEIPDVESVHLNFDGITYAKGASVLKQLVAWVGEDRFLEGTRRYFRRHEFGNAELDDFLGALEEVSGRDLHAWSKEWLEAAGVNTLRPELVESDGRLESVRIVQSAPEEWPTIRSHRLAVGLYDREGEGLVLRRRVELDVVGRETEISELAGEATPDLLLLNDGDMTFAKVRLDDRSLAALGERLSELPDSLARAVCWTAAWDMTRDGELAAREYLRLVLLHAEREPKVGLVQTLLGQAASAIHAYGDPANAPAAMQALADAALGALDRAEAGSDHQLTWARAFADAARSDEHLALLAAILEGSSSYEGLEVDTEFRWYLVRALAAKGRLEQDGIEAELERDPTDAGRRRAAAARAARPTQAAKAEAWRTILEDTTLPLAYLSEVMGGFQQPGQLDVLAPYVAPFFDAVPGVWETRDLRVSLGFGRYMYPHQVVSEDTVRATDAYLDGRDVPGPIRRMLLEGRDGIVRAIRARAVDAAAGDA